jgi:hypothetical protein
MCLNVQVHQSWTIGSSAARQCFIAKVITHQSGVRLRSMSTWWKPYLISFQIDLVSPQYHVSKVSKSLWQVVTISAESYDVVMGLLFTLGTQTQVRSRPKKMENTQEILKDILHLGHHLRRQPRASKPSWMLRSSEPVCNKMDVRTHSDSVFDDP